MESRIEDLIESARNKKEPAYLRRSWIIQARSKLNDASRRLIELEKEISNLE